MSAPHEVHFCGFRSTTALLQQAGWQLSVDQQGFSERLQLILYNKDFGGYMIAEPLNHYPYRRLEFSERLVFVVQRVNADVLIYHTTTDFSAFEPIDARPQIVDAAAPKSIKDFNIFASQLVRTEEIIIEPQSVAECLALIRKMQAPELAEIRKRNETRDFMAASNRQVFHAQVMSLAA